MNRQIDAWKVGRWLEEADPWERIHLTAYRAPGAGKELGLTPSKTLDMSFTQGEFATITSCLDILDLFLHLDY